VKFHNKTELSHHIDALKAKGMSIGFVPTMGALHNGHLSLVNIGLNQNDIVVVSIFVNPTQFDNKEDLTKYPRTLDADIALLKTVSDDSILVYAPTVGDIYGDSIVSQSFTYDGLEHEMEGAFRDGHFDGVGTIVKRLLEIVKPYYAYFGNINERRHQLHEVIRLSGINLVINDLDMPLIIKVASIPKERIQVYFIDNEDYFKRKATLTDEDGKLFSDNDERAIFFAKGVIETVKKLNWAPDIIHVNGWLASLLPLYLKEFYKTEPLFKESKIVTSVYNQNFEGTLDEGMLAKVNFDGLDEESTKSLAKPDYINLMKIAIDNSDAVIRGSEELPKELDTYITELTKPVLDFYSIEEFADPYTEFYIDTVLNS